MDSKEKAREKWATSISKRTTELRSKNKKMTDKEWMKWLAKWRKLNGFPEPETYLIPCTNPKNWIKKAQKMIK